jgi:tetratricopeptide (TPR) repeat protein
MSTHIRSPHALTFVCVLALAASTEAQNLTYRGKECRVKTTLKSKVAKPIVKRIDRYCDHFKEFYDDLGMKPRASNKAVVRIFASYDEFADFTRKTTRMSSVPAAYFSPSLNGVVSYNDPGNPYTRQVLFHEISHQYMNRYTTAAPKWANEGLAEYFEGWSLSPEGELVKKKAAFYDLMVVQQALEEDNALSLKQLIEMEPLKFMEFRENYPDYHHYLHYSTSWSLIYYFLQGSNEADTELYVEFMRDLGDRGELADPFEVDDWEAFEERWKTFVLSLEVVPETADDYQILAANYRSEKEYKKAIEAYEKQLELAPETNDSQYWLGFCHKKLGDYDGAREVLAPMTARDEPDGDAAYLLARIESGLDQKKPKSQDFELALRYAQIASDFYEDESAYHLKFVAELQHHLGDSKAAVKTMKKILKLVKKDEDDVIEYYEGLLEKYDT